MRGTVRECNTLAMYEHSFQHLYAKKKLYGQGTNFLKFIPEKLNTTIWSASLPKYIIWTTLVKRSDFRMTYSCFERRDPIRFVFVSLYLALFIVYFAINLHVESAFPKE